MFIIDFRVQSPHAKGTITSTHIQTFVNGLPTFIPSAFKGDLRYTLKISIYLRSITKNKLCFPFNKQKCLIDFLSCQLCSEHAVKPVAWQSATT